jgi:signal transduction histidine kinase
LRQLERQQTAFLRVMTHELCTPLGRVIGFTELVSVGHRS